MGTACRCKLNKPKNNIKVEGRLLGKRKDVMAGWTCQSTYENVTMLNLLFCVKWIYTNKKFKAVMTYGFMYTYYHGINDQVDTRFCVFSKLLFSQELFIRSPWFLMCTQRWDHYSENAPFNAIISPSCRTSIWLFLCAF